MEVITVTQPVIDPERMQQITEAASRLIDAFKELARKIIEAIRPVVEAIAKVFGKWMDGMMQAASPSRKWWHYYRHAKKARVRKKYRSKLMDNLLTTMAAANTL